MNNISRFFCTFALEMETTLSTDKSFMETGGTISRIDMKNLTFLFLLVSLLAIGGCSDNAPKTEAEAQEQPVQTYTIERYKLFPTQNMWTFIKLDTRTGQMWQLQYSINDEKGRFEYNLNPNSLIADGKKVNGRFELYPTQNIYNFILLDKVDGKTWQVQWSLEEENRAVFPIDK